MVGGQLEYRHATDVHGVLRCFHIEVRCVACPELPDGSRHFRRLPIAGIWAGFLNFSRDAWAIPNGPWSRNGQSSPSGIASRSSAKVTRPFADRGSMASSLQRPELSPKRRSFPVFSL